MNSTSKRFVVGFSVTVFAALILNAVPFFLTRGAYNGDGFEVIGFPFTFRRLGGIAGIYEFRTLALFADVAIGVVAGAIVGYLNTRVRQRD